MNKDEIIIYDDDELVVLNKPAGVLSHRQRVDDQKDARQLAEELLFLPEKTLKPIHRLDATTSGLMLFGKNKRAARYYCQLLAAHKIKKEYLTIVSGSVQDKETVIGGCIKATSKRSYVVEEGGKKAETRVTVKEHLQGFTFCQVNIESGRKHQIRVHLASIGHPLLGDKLYGYEDISSHSLEIDYPILHAAKLLILGKNNQRKKFQAPLPCHFEEILAELRKGCK